MLLHRLSRWGCSIIAVGLITACASSASAAHIPGMSQLGGWVYIDRNNDGQLAFLGSPNPEFVIGQVRVDLYSVVGGFQSTLPVEQTFTDDYGRYLFENITPGQYNMYEMQPVAYVDGKDTLGSLIQLGGGSLPSSSAGSVATKPLPSPVGGAFLNMVLTANIGGEFYNFGERGLAMGYASKTELFASTPTSNTTIPEPTSTFLALSTVLSGCLVPGRRKRS